MVHVEQLVATTDIGTGRLCLLLPALSIIACWLAAENIVSAQQHHVSVAVGLAVSQWDSLEWTPSPNGSHTKNPSKTSRIVATKKTANHPEYLIQDEI